MKTLDMISLAIGNGKSFFYRQLGSLDWKYELSMSSSWSRNLEKWNDDAYDKMEVAITTSIGYQSTLEMLLC